MIKMENMTQYEELSKVNNENEEMYDETAQKSQDQWEDRILKCRERNREHAKRTRLRKKVGLDGMKQRLLQLQNEVKDRNKSSFVFSKLLRLIF